MKLKFAQPILTEENLKLVKEIGLKGCRGELAGDTSNA